MRGVFSLLLAIAIGMLSVAALGLGAMGIACAAVPPGPQTPPAAAPSTEDFLASVAMSTRFEIDSGKLALERAKSAAVKNFAYRMVDDYNSAAARFKEAVSRSRLPPLPEKLDARYQAMLDDLGARDAASFDKAYVAGQVQVLRDLADLLRTYALLGDDARIKRLAQELMLPVRSQFDDASKLR